MKKTLLRILLVICTLLLISAIAVSGKTKIDFKTTYSTNQTDGGYYALGSSIVLSDAGENALKISGAEGGDRGIWAFTNAVVDENPYLTYELPEGGVVYKMTISKYWDVEPEIELVVTPGKHTVNIKEMLANQTTVGYTYVALYVKGEVTVSGLALNSEGASVPVNPPTPDTADALSIAAAAAVLSFAAVIPFVKKRR